MLKVGFNKVSGFYFELSALQAKHAPEYFTRRQTLKMPNALSRQRSKPLKNPIYRLKGKR